MKPTNTLEKSLEIGNQNNIVVYTDGGCHNNMNAKKGIGAWAFAIKNNNKIEVYGQLALNTTNNRTEMMAILKALEYIKKPMTIVSDSKYVVEGFTNPSYLSRWTVNGWVTSSNTPVLNVDLWQSLQLASYHTPFQMIHIRGHKKDKDYVHSFWNSFVDKACSYLMENYIIFIENHPQWAVIPNTNNNCEVMGLCSMVKLTYDVHTGILLSVIAVDKVDEI